MRLVRRLHEEILETSDVKILESAIQNQSALTAKSVVETLRGDGSFSKSLTGEEMTCTIFEYRCNGLNGQLPLARLKFVVPV